MEKRQYRTKFIHVRMTDEEQRSINVKAEIAGITISEFVRRAASGRKIIPRIEQNLINELRKIGGLLKHIHNESNGAYSDKTAAAIDEIRDAVRRVGRG